MAVHTDRGALCKAERFGSESARGWIGSEGKFERDRYHRPDEGQSAEELPVPAVGLCTSVSASSSKILVFGWLWDVF